ncbi:MAG: AEC family transporter [Pseudomonadota bacterium]
MMASVITGLVPIAATIMLGWLARRTALVPADLWAGVNKLAYVVLLPALLFATIARTDFETTQAGRAVLAATLGFGAVALITVMIKRVIHTDDPSFSSIFQGAIRWNGFVILALAQTSLTPEQAAIIALVFAPTVPLINILSVAALSIWGSHQETVNLRRVLMRIITNPLIIGCCVGLVFSFAAPLRTPLLLQTADLIGRAALPLMLLAVGAALNFTAIGARPRLLALSTSIKLVLSPLIFISMGTLLGLSSDALVVLAAIGAAPGAASAYVLAKELGGNADLSAGHITSTTLLAFISLPLWMAYCA